jgi:VanZ family protein
MLLSISLSPPRTRGGAGGGTGGEPSNMIRPFAITLAICLIYAALDEWTQPFIGRTCELLDWLADAGGAIVGSLIGLAIARRFSLFAGARIER